MSGLCFRCEFRARFLEETLRPRDQCGLIDKAIDYCYMFRPVKPPLFKPSRGDKRPIASDWRISARMDRISRDPDLELRLLKDKKDYLLIWVTK